MRKKQHFGLMIHCRIANKQCLHHLFSIADPSCLQVCRNIVFRICRW